MNWTLDVHLIVVTSLAKVFVMDIFGKNEMSFQFPQVFPNLVIIVFRMLPKKEFCGFKVGMEELLL